LTLAFYCLLSFLVPVKQITMNGTDPLVLREGHTIVVTCTTSVSRPPASISWYKNETRLISDATTTTEIQTGEKYITRSFLTLTGNIIDNGKMLKCEGDNTLEEKVTDTITLNIWCKHMCSKSIN